MLDYALLIPCFIASVHVVVCIVFFLIMILISMRECTRYHNDAVGNTNSTETGVKYIKYVDNYAFYDDKQNFLYYWTGNLKQGKPTDEGLAIYAKGDKDGRRRYEGKMHEGKRTAGKLLYNNGDTYEGTFTGDHFDTGTFYVSSSGEKFVGAFKNDQPYNGTWYNNKGIGIQNVVKGK